MANTNPDRRNEGRKVIIIASWVASSCDRATMLNSIPMERPPTRNAAEETTRRA